MNENTTQHFNNLTEGELERIAILMEECGEVVHICGKILRHGLESYNPFDENKITNRTLLTKELADVNYAIKLMISSADIIENDIIALTCLRELKIKNYLHHQQ